LDKRIASFAERHKTPAQEDIDGLFRFLSFSEEPSALEKHKAMLTEGWLYHTTQDMLNDPHDLRFKLKWPEVDDTEGVDGFIEDIEVLLALNSNLPIKKNLTVQSLIEDDSIKNKFETAMTSFYSKARICCFTTNPRNPLFWAHYANSHKGYCVKFKTNNHPHSVINNTRKIFYSDNYPTIQFPVLTNLISCLSIIFQKSTEWKYEDEYRSVFDSEWPNQLKNNGTALSLQNDDISDIYFGKAMNENAKSQIVSLVEAGNFNPQFWNTYISKDGFDLVFSKYLT
jgi:hypothetical protein